MTLTDLVPVPGTLSPTPIPAARGTRMEIAGLSKTTDGSVSHLIYVDMLIYVVNINALNRINILVTISCSCLMLNCWRSNISNQQLLPRPCISNSNLIVRSPFSLSETLHRSLGEREHEDIL